MRSIKAAWQKAGQINNWDGAEDIDLDYPDVIASYTPLVDGWKFILSDKWLLAIVAGQMALIAWLVAETAFLTNLLPIWLKDAISVVGMLAIIGLSCQFGWAALSSRADDVFARRASGVATFGRALRGTIYLLPFGVMPALFLSRILSIFVPVKLVSLRLWFGYDGFEVPARYWHLMVGFVGSSRDVTVEKAANLTVDCRLKVYDIAAEDSRRYRAGLGIGFMITPAMALCAGLWPQVAYVLALPILLYMGLVVYHQAPAIVCLAHVAHTDFNAGKKDEVLPSVQNLDRAGFLIYGAYGIAYALLMCIAIAIPIGRDLFDHDEATIDVGKVDAACRQRILVDKLRSLDEIAASGKKIEECVAAERKALVPKRTLTESFTTYIAINKAGESPAFIRQLLNRQR